MRLIKEMKIVKTVAQGNLMIDGASIAVYKLDNGKYAVGQSAIYKYLTAGNTATASRYNLGISNLGKYLPKKLLTDSEFAVEIDLKPVRLFTSEEWLSICKGILLANIDGKINKKWTEAPRRLQLLLILFAESGIEKAIEKALRSNPVTINDSFENHLVRLLGYKC